MEFIKNHFGAAEKNRRVSSTLTPDSWILSFETRLYRVSIVNNMENDQKEFVDLYWPRKCSSSNRIIHAKDHASIQLTLADVDPITGRMTDTHKMYAVCGSIRRMGESDDCIVRLAKKDGIIAKNY
ncbi:GSCOCG00000435001-RA-CDS [Cotesia congregata]|uniref:Small ribosomal subunit protein eS21 n=1 Tax=Cotesia congregata TaxID=51543 RepID=A0A8J2MJN7_COTCN|nr:GSCOCG00000435001-RA-CDS [Cotesia congregata]CAG5088032.1 Similar to RpS21: 40S ribosomal protein S21 (Spodoptera frugiperda) [Cotesia congregata]